MFQSRAPLFSDPAQDSSRTASLRLLSPMCLAGGGQKHRVDFCSCRHADFSERGMQEERQRLLKVTGSGRVCSLVPALSLHYCPTDLLQRFSHSLSLSRSKTVWQRFSYTMGQCRTAERLPHKSFWDAEQSTMCNLKQNGLKKMSKLSNNAKIWQCTNT